MSQFSFTRALEGPQEQNDSTGVDTSPPEHCVSTFIQNSMPHLSCIDFNRAARLPGISFRTNLDDMIQTSLINEATDADTSLPEHRVSIGTIVQIRRTQLLRNIISHGLGDLEGFGSGPYRPMTLDRAHHYVLDVHTLPRWADNWAMRVLNEGETDESETEVVGFFDYSSSSETEDDLPSSSTRRVEPSDDRDTEV